MIGEKITAGEAIEEIKYNEYSKMVNILITQILLNQSIHGDKK